MNVMYHPYDQKKFATAIRKDSITKNLMWDNAKGQGVLIMQTAYGVYPLDNITYICDVLKSTQFHFDCFTEIAAGINVRFVSAADKARMSGCPLHGEASTYTVLSCDLQENCLHLYAPQSDALDACSCSIPLECKVEIQEIMKMTGFFKKKNESTGFYAVTFPQITNTEFINNNLLLQIDNLQIPVNQEMLSKQTIYIKTQIKPKFISCNHGLKLV